MTRKLMVVWVAALTLWSTAAHASNTLELSQLLRGLDATHPELERARQDVRRAKAEQLSARGGFDPKLKLGAKKYVYGYYDKGQLEALLSQSTPLWGTELYAGWRRSLGNRIPIYDGDIETLSGGEVRMGMDIPLWRNGRIDKRRAEITKARLNTQQTQLELQAFRMLVRNAAAHAYWNWVEAGLKLEIEEDLLKLALRRDAGLRRRAAKGDAAGIIAIDSQRSILTRRTRVIAAGQKLRQAALKLSLFYRDSRQRPIAPVPGRLPKAMPEATEPNRDRLVADLQRALRKRPDLQALRRSRQRADVDVDFQENQIAPDLRLWSEVAKDVGAGSKTLQPWDFAVGISIETPLPMRRARGQAKAARAKRGAVSAKLRASRDKVATEIQMAYTALEAAYRSVDLARRAREAAEQLAEAERRKLELGSSDLLILTLRETAAADSASKEVAAQANYQRARADYLTTTARGLR